MNSFKVTITTKHLLESPGYESPNNCPLALAIKDVFPGALVGVSYGNAKIDSKTYVYEGKLWYSGVSNNGVCRVDNMIKLAKENEFEMEPVEIELVIQS